MNFGMNPFQHCSNPSTLSRSAAQNFDSEKQKLISSIMSNLVKPTTKRKNPYKHLTEGGLMLQSSQFR